MPDNGYIPAATAEKLAASHPKGTRHQAKIDIAVPLIGNGIPPQAVFVTLREKFPEASDKELEGVIKWAVDRRPTPSGFGERPKSNGQSWSLPARTAHAEKKRSPAEHTDWWISESRMSADQMADSSPIKLPDDPVDCACLAVASLYTEADRLNVVCKFIMDGPKAKPLGAGKTMLRDEWIAYFHGSGVPHSEAGAWMRINPCGDGTGADGAITDADITAWRYVLVESDVLPLEVQLALYRRLKLPIAAVWLSGGASAHAVVKLESANGEHYRDTGNRLLKLLSPFGIDQANKNPSRLSRLPGAVRKIGASGDGLQRLLWLNPTCQALTDEQMLRLEESFAFPDIEEKPLRTLANNAIIRYEEMYKNRGKLGVPVGIPDFDKVSGGLKPGHTIVIAGTTGGGKTTFGLHAALSALAAGYGVLMFSLEMDRDEIFDLMMSNRCSISRNKFNNGEFHEDDFGVMAEQLKGVKEFPFYIEDSPLSSVDQIRLRTMQLKAAGKIGLVIVDYVQFVNPGAVKESREQQVAQISHALRALARESRLPMIVLSQLNDEGKLRESRVIAHNANIVMTSEISGHEFKVRVIKGRSVPCGEYRMNFNPIFGQLYATENPQPTLPHSDP